MTMSREEEGAVRGSDKAVYISHEIRRTVGVARLSLSYQVETAEARLAA